jgi:hypothetical protein
MTNPSQLTWFAVIAVFAATVVTHGLLTMALSRAKQAWVRRKAAPNTAQEPPARSAAAEGDPRRAQVRPGAYPLVAHHTPMSME